MTEPRGAPEEGGLPQGAHRRLSFRFKQSLFGTIILLVSLLGWLVAYQATRRLANSAERVARTQEIISSVWGASGALEQAETAYREYVQSARTEDLQAYRAAIDAHRNQVENLRRLVGDDASQRARLDSLDRLVGGHVTRLNSLVAALDSEGTTAALAQAAQSMGHEFTPEIRPLLEGVEQAELAVLAGQVDEARSNVRSNTGMLIATGVVTLLVLFGISRLFNRRLARQQRHEQRLRSELRAADAANEAKTRFLATVSHEIRTPLNAVSGMSELLLDTRLDSEQTQYARTVHSNAEALALLIGDLLDSSKIEAGQVDLESLPFDLRELVEGVAEILVVRADIKGVELIVDVAPNVPRSLVGDRNRLRQVVMNLIGNAVKFTEQGEVIVRVHAEPSDGGRSAKLHLGVIDTGIGIAPEAQTRIFERFVQAERSTVRRYGGTGLGLSISRSLIELMGGTLTLQSELGRGSRFAAEVTLPVADTQPLLDVVPSSLSGIGVLLVEANKSSRETTSRLLQFAGATVEEAGTAAEALEIARSESRARVIVVGEHLPDSTGPELARMVAHGGDGTVPRPAIILLCSLRSMMTRYVGSDGIRTCVYKPVKQARLIQAVREAAGSEGEETIPEHEPPIQTSGGLTPPRILLVEDHRDNSALATRILVSAGYELDLAEDGGKAVELAASFRYDLILMDVELPQMDGIEATQRIRVHERDCQQRPVPIVALTAHAVEGVRHEARSAGMDDYATKPLHKQQLLDVCARWVDLRPRLLIADDSPENHVLLTNYLAGNDYRLVSAYNGRDAVDAFERERVSLVLLDMDMPVMTGYEAARAIRRARGGEAVPIVALTGYEGPEERQRCLTAGCNGYLLKPVHRVDLLATIDALIGRPRAVGRPPSAARQGPSSEGDSAGKAARLPSGRDFSNQLRSLLARRDFDAVVTLAESLEATAEKLQLNKLATVSAELAGAARQRDEQRSMWWGEQSAPVLREAQRLVAVRYSAGTSAGASYDALARLATKLLGVPSAAVTLLDEDRVRIKGAAGIPVPVGTARELPLADSLGRFVTAQGSPLLVEDARKDPRMRETPLVISHGLGSYGGVPLTSSQGITLGAFCAMDTRPHTWPPEDVGLLEDLASIASQMLDMERTIANPARRKSDRVATEPNTMTSSTAFPPAPDATLVTVEDDIIDLVPEYLASRRHNVETLRTLLDHGDFDGISRLGHNMKGSGQGYGLPEVSRIGKALEDAARLGDATSIADGIDDLNGYLSRLSVRSADGRILVEP